MKQLAVLAFTACISCDSAAKADEYLVRVDTVGYGDRSSSEGNPKETLLRSIEVVARPGSAFHSKVKTGRHTLVVSGMLRPAEAGRFEVQVRYSYLVDTGISVPARNGGRKPVPDTSTIETQVAVAVDDAVTLGRAETSASGSHHPERRSAVRYVLRLARYAPTDG